MRASPRHCTRLHCLPRGRPGCDPAVWGRVRSGGKEGGSRGRDEIRTSDKTGNDGKSEKTCGTGRTAGRTAGRLPVRAAAASADGDRRFCAGRNLPHRAGGGQYLGRPQRTARLAAVAGGQFDVALQSDLAPEPYQPRRNRYARPLYRQLHPDGRHDQPRERRPLRHHDQAPDGRLRLYRRPSRATAQRRFVVAVHRV